MKILAIADEESKSLWDYFEKSKLEGIDLILSCGDLNPNYLSFLATFSSAPVLYIHGNHDDRYAKTPPEGCINIEDQVYVHNGVRILGLGGSLRYKPGIHQYTQRQMNWRLRRAAFQIRRNRGIDILLTHAPAAEIHDGADLPHQGFQAFNRAIERYHPYLFLHGHVHLSYSAFGERHTAHGSTNIINAYDRCIIDFDPEAIRNASPPPPRLLYY